MVEGGMRLFGARDPTFARGLFRLAGGGGRTRTVRRNMHPAPTLRTFRPFPSKLRFGLNPGKKPEFRPVVASALVHWRTSGAPLETSRPTGRPFSTTRRELVLRRTQPDCRL